MSKLVTNSDWDFPTRATRRPERTRVINGKRYRLSDIEIVTHCRCCGEKLNDDEMRDARETCDDAECEGAV